MCGSPLLAWVMAVALGLVVDVSGGGPGPPAASPVELPRGVIVDPVACLTVPEETYALYLPSGYTPERRWPILYAFDARRRGRAPVERFLAAAEELGWIIASSNSSRSDESMAPNIAAMKAMWEDTQARFAIAPRRAYATGFSGGARVACLLAQVRRGEVVGVVGCGGGFPFERPPSRDAPFAFLGLAGTRDFNFAELRDLDARLAELGLPHRFESFDGGHQWPPPEMAREALMWLEVLAMRDGTTPPRPEFLAQRWTAQLERARAFAAGGDPVAAVARLEGMRAEFRGLQPAAALETVAGEAARRRGSPEFARAEAAQRQAEEEHAAYLRRARARLTELLAQEPEAVRPERALAALEVPSLIRARRELGDSYAGLAVQRSLESLRVFTGFYQPRDLLARHDYGRAVLVLRVAAAIPPEHAEAWYALGGAQAQGGDKRGAVASLRRAVALGFRDRARLEADPAFARLHGTSGYREILAGLAAPAGG